MDGNLNLFAALLICSGDRNVGDPNGCAERTLPFLTKSTVELSILALVSKVFKSLRSTKELVEFFRVADEGVVGIGLSLRT